MSSVAKMCAKSKESTRKMKTSWKFFGVEEEKGKKQRYNK
jgi:hypothetical protein